MNLKNTLRALSLCTAVIFLTACVSSASIATKIPTPEIISTNTPDPEVLLFSETPAEWITLQKDEINSLARLFAEFNEEKLTLIGVNRVQTGESSFVLGRITSEGGEEHLAIKMDAGSGENEADWVILKDQDSPDGKYAGLAMSVDGKMLPIVSVNKETGEIFFYNNKTGEFHRLEDAEAFGADGQVGLLLMIKIAENVDLEAGREVMKESEMRWNFGWDDETGELVIKNLDTGEQLQRWNSESNEWVEMGKWWIEDLVVEDSEMLEVAYGEGMQDEVVEGSELAEIGLPVGARLTVMNGELVYAVQNPVGEVVKVGQLNAENQWEIADALKYELAMTPEDAVNVKLPWEFIKRGGPSQVAKLGGESFDEDVETGQDIYVGDGNSGSNSGTTSFLEWRNENIERQPCNRVGYFSLKNVDEYKKSYVGSVYQWKNGDGSIVYITYLYGHDNFEEITMSETELPFGFYSGENHTPPLTTIAADAEINALLQQWADTDIVPVELEEKVVVGQWR